jgi:aspartyl aminopeptidase
MTPVALSPVSVLSPPPAPSADFGSLVEACIDRTAAALSDSRAANDSDISHALEAVRRAQAEGTRVDLLQALAVTQGHQEEHVGNVILNLAEKVAGTLTPVPQLIPFAGKLIAPSAFYESYEALYKTAAALLTPVIFAEDTDSIGVASANPIAAALLASAIQEVVFRRFGIRPFLTVARLDYESWTFLTRKHFEL